MSEREKLPNRRNHQIVEFEISGVGYRASIEDGRVAELFLDLGGKIGSAACTAAWDGAIAHRYLRHRRRRAHHHSQSSTTESTGLLRHRASLALQHGVSVETLRHALMRQSDGSGAGPISRAFDLFSEAAS